MTQTNSTLSRFPLKLQRQDHFLDFLTIIVQSLYWRAHNKLILITNMVILALTRHFTFIKYKVNFGSEIRGYLIANSPNIWEKLTEINCMLKRKKVKKMQKKSFFPIFVCVFICLVKKLTSLWPACLQMLSIHILVHSFF